MPTSRVRWVCGWFPFTSETSVGGGLRSGTDRSYVSGGALNAAWTVRQWRLLLLLLLLPLLLLVLLLLLLLLLLPLLLLMMLLVLRLLRPLPHLWLRQLWLRCLLCLYYECSMYSRLC